MARRLLLISAGLLATLVIGVGTAVVLLRSDEEPAPAKLTPLTGVVVPGTETALQVAAGKHIALRDRPGGRIVRRLGDKTEFGSPQYLSPTGEKRGAWLAVRHPSLRENVGWMHAANRSVRWHPRTVRLDVNLARRELLVFVGNGAVDQRFEIAIGAPETPTPPGEYYVTDKLRGADFGEFYGCCILALSGRQPNLPQGWSGGDRLAIHGSPTPTWGQNVSNGCLHARTEDLRYLMKTVPLGTVVTVRA